MFLIDWFYGILTSLGLRQKEAKIKEANILFLGLENSGKAMLLRKLKESEISSTPANAVPYIRENDAEYMNQRLFQYQPMRDPTSEELSIGKIKFKLFDLGGHQIARRVWKDYNAKVDAVVYVVERRNLGRHAELRTELDALLSDESLANVPFLIFAHGFDGPVSKELLLEFLRLSKFINGEGMENLGDTNVRPLELFKYTLERWYPTSDILQRNLLQGHIDGFKWLSQYIK